MNKCRYYKDIEFESCPTLYKVDKRGVVVCQKDNIWKDSIWSLAEFETYLSQDSTKVIEITEEEANSIMIMRELVDQDEVGFTISEMMAELNRITIIPMKPLEVNPIKTKSIINRLMNKIDNIRTKFNG